MGAVDGDRRESTPPALRDRRQAGRENAKALGHARLALGHRQQRPMERSPERHTALRVCIARNGKAGARGTVG